MTYKKHSIQAWESPIQRVYVIDGDTSTAYWSISDAKRAINGEPILFQPCSIDPTFFKPIV